MLGSSLETGVPWLRVDFLDELLFLIFADKVRNVVQSFDFLSSDHFFHVDDLSIIMIYG